MDNVIAGGVGQLGTRKTLEKDDEERVLKKITTKDKTGENDIENGRNIVNGNKRKGEKGNYTFVVSRDSTVQ